MSNTRKLRVIDGGRLRRPRHTWGTRSRGFNANQHRRPDRGTFKEAPRATGGRS
jgi:hypothetical protein